MGEKAYVWGSGAQCSGRMVYSIRRRPKHKGVHKAIAQEVVEMVGKATSCWAWSHDEDVAFIMNVMEISWRLLFREIK